MLPCWQPSEQMRKLRLWAIRWLACSHVASANGILVEALPWLLLWSSPNVTNLAAGSQAHYLPSLALSFPICEMDWPVCLPVFTWLLYSMNEMTVTCVAPKRG